MTKYYNLYEEPGMIDLIIRGLHRENLERVAKLQRVSDQKVQWRRFIAERGTRQEKQRKV